MPTISSMSSAQQYGLQQLRQQQAQRNADQAEQAARSLKAQADQAQAVADRAQENARELNAQSDQAQVKAGQARQGLAAAASVQQAAVQLGNVASQVVSRSEGSASSTPSASASPVVNTQGQVTGAIINTTA